MTAIDREKPVLRTMKQLQQDASASIVAEIAMGVDAGMSQRQIAAAMGVSPTTISRIMAAQGLEVRRELVKKGSDDGV